MKKLLKLKNKIAAKFSKYVFKQNLKNIIRKNIKTVSPIEYRCVPDLSDIITETKLEMIPPPRIPDEIIEETALKSDIKGLARTYCFLSDDYSRKLFLQLVAYRLLGPSRISLPLSDKSKWLEIEEIEKNCKKQEIMKTTFWDLNLFDLSHINYDIRLFFNTESVFIGLFLKEYGYDKNGVNFKVEEGDYVIDAGACYGDTALYFAHDAGENGKVFSFEFLNENLEVFNKNIELNPHLKERITLFKNPVWSKSKEKLYVIENGPATYCSTIKPEAECKIAATASIDDIVQNNSINKIDFIKMDIEGAELEALYGAQETIKKHKPKLAICLYHNFNHFVSIPQYIKQLVPEYKMYIDHHTMSEGETVLYATI